MPRPIIPLSQRGGQFMWTTRAETAPAGSYHYALNMVPLEPLRPDSLLVQRPSIAPIGSNTLSGTLVATGQMSKADGTVVTWILTTNGLWQVAAGAYTNVVTAANLATGSVTVPATTHYWCVFNHTVVFNPSDGTNKPWTWDGTSGASGLTPLSNAAIAYGRPTVRSAKLFFIKYAERDTIVWSEEAAANTGYEAGGYSNVWKLGQTGTAPLFAIYGTNDGLYYFRLSSIGVIRGEVNAEFVTASTHDAVSRSVGTTSPAGVTAVDTDLWFVDQFGIPQVLPAGGTPVPVLQEIRSEPTAAEPFGFDDVGWSRNVAPGSANVEVLAVPPLGSMPYKTVWFNVTASVPTAGRAMLVCHAESRRALAWFVPFIGAALSVYSGLYYDSSAGKVYPYVVQASNAVAFRWTDGYSDGDVNSSSVTQTTTYRVIGSPMGATDTGEYQFDRIAFVGSASGTTRTANVQLMTSRRDSAATISTAQTPIIGTSGSLDRKVVGLNQNGRWCRPVFTVTASDLGKWNLASWTVWAYPVGTGPAVP